MYSYVCMYRSGSKRFSTLSDTQTPLLSIFPLAFIQVSFVHGLLYSFNSVFLRSSSCSLFILASTSMLFWAIFLLPFFEPWPHHVNWFYSIFFIIVSSSPICCLIVTFLILAFLVILQDLLRASISVASTRFLLLSVSLHVSEPQGVCDFDRASSLICGNKMPTRCNRGFYFRSYCLLNMFRAPLCPSSGAQVYYTVFAACGISCCGFQVAGLVWS